METITSIVMALVAVSLLFVTVPAVTSLIAPALSAPEPGISAPGGASDTQTFGLSLDPPQNAPAPLAAPGIDTSTADTAIRFGDPFDFRWSRVGGVRRYQFQLAADEAFTTVLMDAEGRVQSVPADTLQPGRYFWRVRALDGGREGQWSQTSRLIVSPQAWQLPIASQRPYAADSVWNTPIGPNPAYDPYSEHMVATFADTRRGGRIGSDTTRFTFPVYYADADTPRYNVPCVRWKCSVEAGGDTVRVEVMEGVPIPDGAQPSAGDDAQWIIVDTVAGTEYGFFEVRRGTDGGWEASNGYRVDLHGGGNPANFGSRGAGVPYFAGLIRAWEIRAGEISHAVAFAYEHTAARGCVFPATQTDGRSDLQFAIPEGARLQLNPSLTDADFDRMGLSRAGKIVARALQQYGMVLIDTGGSPKIMAENLSDNLFAPFDWHDPDLAYTTEVIEGIPYTEFRVLDLPDGYWQGAAPNWGKCIR